MNIKYTVFIYLPFPNTNDCLNLSTFLCLEGRQLQDPKGEERGGGEAVPLLSRYVIDNILFM